MATVKIQIAPFQPIEASLDGFGGKRCLPIKELLEKTFAVQAWEPHPDFEMDGVEQATHTESRTAI